MRPEKSSAGQGRRERVALVLSGGGALGAYEVGVLKALCQGLCPGLGPRKLEATLRVGTSVGAFNAAFLAARVRAPSSVSLCIMV